MQLKCETTGELRTLLRSLGAIHKRAMRDGDDWSIEMVERVAADVLGGNGIPYRSVRLMLASYWPLEVSRRSEPC